MHIWLVGMSVQTEIESECGCHIRIVPETDAAVRSLLITMNQLLRNTAILKLFETNWSTARYIIMARRISPLFLNKLPEHSHALQTWTTLYDEEYELG